VTGHNQIGHSRAESALVAFQCLHSLSSGRRFRRT
jgi:hypothetical protein